MKGWKKYLALVGVNLIYAFVSVLTKTASLYDFLSLEYILAIACGVLVLGIYAFSWQQIIKRMPISEAYMFKGTSIVFILLLSAWLFCENITLQNIIGSIIIILGIVLFAKSDKEVSK
jgi:drug/metabolite transporter (DMT)-like permease